jgi:hypothetical protein
LRPSEIGGNICGNCARELIDEEEAQIAALSAEAEAQAKEEEYEKWQAEQHEGEYHDRYWR